MRERVVREISRNLPPKNANSRRLGNLRNNIRIVLFESLDNVLPKLVGRKSPLVENYTIQWYTFADAGPGTSSSMIGEWATIIDMEGGGFGARSRKTQTHVKFSYPQYAMKPEDLLDFIELAPFTRRWEKLGLDDENDLAALQLFIMTDPTAHPLVKGTRGLRKLRFAPEQWKTGRSGAARVLYKHFENYGIVLLCLVYGKDEIDDISPVVKKYLNKLIDEVERELERRFSP